MYRSTTRTQINFVVNYIIYLYTQRIATHNNNFSVLLYPHNNFDEIFLLARARLTLMHRNCVCSATKKCDKITHKHTLYIKCAFLAIVLYILLTRTHTLVLMIYNIYSMQFNFILITFLWRWRSTNASSLMRCSAKEVVAMQCKRELTGIR